jgi:hypothetical protein
MGCFGIPITSNKFCCAGSHWYRTHGPIIVSNNWLMDWNTNVVVIQVATLINQWWFVD